MESYADRKKRGRSTRSRGVSRTNRHIVDLLHDALSRLKKEQLARTDILFAAWPNVVGPRVASMTRVLFFREGVLTVEVKQSTLYSVLRQYEGKKILDVLKKEFPKQGVQQINFKLG